MAGHIDVNGVSFSLPDGRPVLHHVSFRVDEGSVTALVGANGSGKTTLMRMVAASGRRETGPVPEEGSISVSGRLGVMAQFVGSVRDATTVRDLLLSLEAEPLRRAASDVVRTERELAESDDEAHQFAYAGALARYGEAGGYEAEVAFDSATTTALGLPLDVAGTRQVASLSGGEQKRLVLCALFSSSADVLLLDEPDNYLDVPGKEWLGEQLAGTRKTVMFVSHDRELLRTSATRVVTLETTAAGSGAWVHGSSYEGYAEARAKRFERLEELHRRHGEERARLAAIVVEMRRKASYNPDFSSKLTNAIHRLERFDRAGPPEAVPRPQRLGIRLRGAGTGKRVLDCVGLALDGLTDPFDLDVIASERIACLGPNGTGKSHFLGLLAGAPVSHSGEFRLGARVVPGHFSQTNEHPELVGHSLSDILHLRHDLPLERAVASLARYELAGAREQRYETLSGGQQARLQILLLELSGATLLLLDEPTDNLDVESAEALEAGLDSFEGTVLAVTHDRYFVRRFDRFVLFRSDGTVLETDEPVFDDGRVERAGAVRRRTARG